MNPLPQRRTIQVLVNKMKPVTQKWKCKDGTIIRICDMKDSHLINCIEFIKRFAQNKMNIQHQVFLTLPEPSGEMAMDCYNSAIEQMAEEIWEDFAPPIFDKLLKEAKRRKLTHKLKI